jgi:hypothetical protein
MGHVDINSLPDRSFVRLEAAANLLGVSASTLKNWSKNGTGPAVGSPRDASARLSGW